MIENAVAADEQDKSIVPRLGSIKVVNQDDHEQVIHERAIELTDLAEIEIFQDWEQLMKEDEYTVMQKEKKTKEEWTIQTGMPTV